MLTSLQPVFYIQVSPERLTLKNVKTGQSISEVPELAISTAPKRRLLAAGSEARVAAAGQAAEVVNPFAHPRSLVSDFTTAELLVKHQLRRLLDRTFLALSPCVVIHPMGDPQGGFTQVERRAFREMAQAQAARQP